MVKEDKLERIIKLKKWLEYNGKYFCNCEEGDCLHEFDKFSEDKCKNPTDLNKWIKVKDILDFVRKS